MIEAFEADMNVFGFNITDLAVVGTTFGTVYGLFARFDADQSESNRIFTRDWLFGIHVDKSRWQAFYIELLGRLFGKKHFSWKCISRSFALSAFLVTVIYARWYLRLQQPLAIADIEGWVVSSALWACLVDYLSLWKTRFLITKIASFKNIFVIIILVIFDFLLTSALWFFFWIANGVIYFLIHSTAEQIKNINSHNAIDALNLGNLRVFDVSDSATLLPIDQLYWAALVTSLWLWAFLVVSFGARVLYYMPATLQFLAKLLDFESHPVRAVGYVAATACAALVGTVTVFYAH